MFKIHTKDGKTTPVDLSTGRGRSEWEARFKDPKYQATITGVTVVKRCGGKTKCGNCGDTRNTSKCNTGVQFSLSRPVDLPNVFYQLELVEPSERTHGGERIICHAGDVSIALMSHANQPASRVILAKTGKRRYNPFIG